MRLLLCGWSSCWGSQVFLDLGERCPSCSRHTDFPSGSQRVVRILSPLHTQTSTKKLACDLIELVIFGYFVQLTLKLIHIYWKIQLTHTQTTLKGVTVCSKKTCRLQTFNSTEATQTTKESCAADSGAEGKICWGETLIIFIITFLLSASRSSKDLTNAALALCSLTQPNPGLLVKGNLPVEFTQGKISKH